MLATKMLGLEIEATAKEAEVVQTGDLHEHLTFRRNARFVNGRWLMSRSTVQSASPKMKPCKDCPRHHYHKSSKFCSCSPNIAMCPKKFANQIIEKACEATSLFE